MTNERHNPKEIAAARFASNLIEPILHHAGTKSRRVVTNGRKGP